MRAAKASIASTRHLAASGPNAAGAVRTLVVRDRGARADRRRQAVSSICKLGAIWLSCSAM